MRRDVSQALKVQLLRCSLITFHSPWILVRLRLGAREEDILWQQRG
jgi:hypothetical protein